MISVTIKTKSHTKKFQRKLEDGTSKALETLMKYAQDKALSYKKGSKNKNMILYEINYKNSESEGRLYTNFDWALFLEYGTGTYAEMPNIGTSKVFIESGFKFWYAPAKSVEKDYLPTDFMVVNGIFYPMMTEINGEPYVIVFEQKPRPYMRPTAFILENEGIDLFVRELRKNLRK